MPAVAVREAAPHELPAVAALTVSAYAAVPDLDTSGWDELSDAAARAAEAVLLVAVGQDGTLLGTVTYVPGPQGRFAEFADADAAGMRMLAVAPQARRRGVARALVRACLARARSAGRARLVLHTMAPLHAAQRLYEGFGFVRAPQRDWEPEPGLALLGYELELADG